LLKMLDTRHIAPAAQIRAGAADCAEFQQSR
jgi:hypothetical protein